MALAAPPLEYRIRKNCRLAMQADSKQKITSGDSSQNYQATRDVNVQASAHCSRASIWMTTTQTHYLSDDQPKLITLLVINMPLAAIQPPERKCQ